MYTILLVVVLTSGFGGTKNSAIAIEKIGSYTTLESCLASASSVHKSNTSYVDSGWYAQCIKIN